MAPLPPRNRACQFPGTRLGQTASHPMASDQGMDLLMALLMYKLQVRDRVRSAPASRHDVVDVKRF